MTVDELKEQSIKNIMAAFPALWRQMPLEAQVALEPLKPMVFCLNGTLRATAKRRLEKALGRVLDIVLPLMIQGEAGVQASLMASDDLFQRNQAANTSFWSTLRVYAHAVAETNRSNNEDSHVGN